MKNYLIILAALVGMGLASCDLGNEPPVDGTATPNFNGEYFIELFDAPGGSLFVPYTLITISNTSANVADRIRVKDDSHIWGFNSEFTTSGNTFSGELRPNALVETPDPLAFDPIGTIYRLESAYPKYMTITDGVIVPNGHIAPSTAVTDSIAFFATARYVLERYEVIGHRLDTLSVDPFETAERNVYQFVSDSLIVDDGPYFLSGYQRTGFLEDEH